MHLSPRQKAFFVIFGYLHLPGVLRERADRIAQGFASVLKAAGSGPRNGFVGRGEELAWLLEDPLVGGVAADLLGEDFNYTGDRGGEYRDAAAWHSAAWQATPLHLSFVFRLDPPGPRGGLRLIPGSHVPGDGFADSLHRHFAGGDSAWGIEGTEIPAVTLQAGPQDLVCIDNNLKRACYDRERRTFSVDLCQRYPEERLADLGAYLRRWGRLPAGGPTLEENAVRRRRSEQVRTCGLI